MCIRDRYNTYHNLWRIEESFKIMKSDLDARPVFLQTEESIKGHFLICYLTVLLERIFQFKVLEDKYSSSEIFGFIKGFKATKAERKYINTTTYSDFIDDLSNRFDLPLTNYFLSKTQIKSILNFKLQFHVKRPPHYCSGLLTFDELAPFLNVCYQRQVLQHLSLIHIQMCIRDRFWDGHGLVFLQVFVLKISLPDQEHFQQSANMTGIQAL